MEKYRDSIGSVLAFESNDAKSKEDSVVIDKGKIYELDDGNHTIIGAEIHLDSVEDGSWLEITKEHLEEYFEEVN